MATFHTSPANYFSRTQQLQQNMPQLQQTQISESPIVQTPGSVTSIQTPPTTAMPTNGGTSPRQKKGAAKKRLTQLVALGALALTVISGGAGLYLMGESQDTRQQASVSNGIGRIFFSPDDGEFATDTLASVDVVLNMGAAIPVNGIQAAIDITGDVPEALEFVESADLEGLSVADVTTTDIPNGKRVVFGLLATPPNPFTTPSGDLILGSLLFTPTTGGSITAKFNPVATKVIQEEGSEDILLTPTQVATYTITQAPEDTSALDDSVANTTASNTFNATEILTATLSGALQVPKNSSLASGSASMAYDLDAEKFTLIATISGILPERITKTSLVTGSPTTSGTVIMDLGNAWATSSGKLTLTLGETAFPATHSAALFDGNVYLNIATTTYPNGEIRGNFLLEAGMGGLEASTSLANKTSSATSPSPSPSPSPTSQTYLDDDRLETASAEAYAMPVTGALENTLLLLALGALMIGIGGYVSFITRNTL